MRLNVSWCACPDSLAGHLGLNDQQAWVADVCHHEEHSLQPSQGRGGEGRGDFCLCNAWFMQDPIAEGPAVLSTGALDPNRPACKGIRRTNSTQHAIKQTRRDLADGATTCSLSMRRLPGGEKLLRSAVIMVKDLLC